MMYILVTGSRHAGFRPWHDLIRDAVRTLVSGEPYRLVHGNAAGIDQLSEAATLHSDHPPVGIHQFPADWKSHGRAAGPIRNQQMLDFLLQRIAEGHTAVCLAFHDDLNRSKGTKHMVRIARQAGIPVTVHDGKGVAA